LELEFAHADLKFCNPCVQPNNHGHVNRYVNMLPDKFSAAVPAHSPAYWIKTLSITGGPLVEGNFRVAITFFLQYYRDINIRTKLASLFQGIDWHQPVMLRSCAPPARVAAFRQVGDEMNLSLPMFFTKPGTSPRALGVVAAGRVFCEYEFAVMTQVLESRVASFVWTRQKHDWQEETRPLHYLGTQYIVPCPWKNLRFVRAGSRVQS
jgi:hypothetical protein